MRKMVVMMVDGQPFRRSEVRQALSQEDNLTTLTSREVRILTHIAEGTSNKRIAMIMGMSEQTIKNHVSAILRKLDANDRAHAVVLAARSGLISIQPDHGENQRAEKPSPQPNGRLTQG